MTTSTRPLPRGIRNHNPGNIIRGADRWLGMAADQSADARLLSLSSDRINSRQLPLFGAI